MLFSRTRIRNFSRENGSGSRSYPLPLNYEVRLHLSSTVHLWDTLARYSYLGGTFTPAKYHTLHLHYEIQQHCRGKASYTRFCTSMYTYDEPLYIWGTTISMRYNYTYEVQLYIRGTTIPTRYYTCTPTRYIYICSTMYSSAQTKSVLRIRIRI